MPALPLDEAGAYVAAAYLVFLVLVLAYVAIMAAKLARVDRRLAELDELRRRDGAQESSATDAGGGPAGADHARVSSRASRAA
ncbi:MAG: hypothetical protein ACRDK9_04825 [Solirubrobacterales bacterium]